ncbi:MAG: transglycosylase domain-containing protein [Ktedonobacteraceae bacterium]|nr:transglycosylase domain-containing protein [Ktedonobacteraceae bacterium]
MSAHSQEPHSTDIAHCKENCDGDRLRHGRALRYLQRKNVRQAQVSLPSVSAHALAGSSSAVIASPTTPTISPTDTQRQHRLLQHGKWRQRHTTRIRWQQARLKQQDAVHHFWLTVFGVISSLLIILLSLLGSGEYVTYRFLTTTQQKYEQRVVTLPSLLPRDNLKVYDSEGVLLAQLTDQGIHTAVSLDQISPNLINATVVAEDKSFWTNSGVDLLRIIRAAIDDLQRGRVVEGGSTITQQLIKNLIVGNETSIVRKLEEIVLIPKLNSLYTKSDILQMYLNSIYYGEQAYGVDAAANVYFGLKDLPGKPAAVQLDLAQAVMLAGLPSYPNGNDPLIHPRVGLQRFETVLDLMVNEGYISNVQARDAIREARSPGFFKRPVGLWQNRAPHFVNFVLSELEKRFHLTRQQLSRSDMSVYTTLDITLQDKIQKILWEHIAELREHNATNAAEVLIDFHSGAIRSLLGSIDYGDKSIDGQFDVATQGYRQPGSSFKPYVYVTAFEQGASPAQAVQDASLTIYLPYSDPPTFSPQNYDLNFHGHMTLRCALQNSLNIPAVKVLQHTGIDAAMKTAHDMGVTNYEGTPGYSLVLGGLGVRLIDHTSAFGTFANGGVHVPYYAIEKVVFQNTRQTYRHPRTTGTRAISPQLAYMMTSVLSDNTSRIPEFADCNPLQLYSNPQSDCWNGNRGAVRPAAAKTGTTTDFRDNWTVGYTTDYVLGVWTGNDNNTPMYNVTGVQGAAPIWHDAMLMAEAGHPIRDFSNPGGLEWAQVTYPDGVQTSDWFLPGTEPTFTHQPTPTPTPGKQHPTPQPVPIVPRPYCPSDYIFAFPPPAKDASDAGWW